MLSNEQLSALLVELGTMSDDVEVIQAIVPGEWVIAFADDEQVAISHDENEERLVLTATLCSLEAATTPTDEDADRVADVCKLLLAYNSLWRESGGLSMALDNVDAGDILLLLHVPIDNLEAVTLGGILNTFRKAANAWADDILVSDATAQEDENESDSAFQANALRV